LDNEAHDKEMEEALDTMHELMDEIIDFNTEVYDDLEKANKN